MTLSDKGKALREIMKNIEESDAKLKKLSDELLFEFNKKEILVVMLKRLTNQIN